MKIASRLKVSFYIYLAIVSIVIIFASFVFRGVVRSIDELEKEVVKQGVVGNFKGAVYELIDNYESYLATHSKADKKLVNQSVVKVRAYINQIEGLSKEQETAVLGEINEEILTMVEGFQDFAEKEISVKKEVPSALKKQISNKMLKVQEMTLRLFNLTYARTQEIREKLEKMRKLMFYSILGLVVLFSFASIVYTINLISKIINPIQDMRETITKIEHGDFSEKVEVKSKDELNELASSFNTMSEYLVDFKGKLEGYNEQLQQQLKNKSAEMEELAAFLQSVFQASTEYAIIALDLEGIILTFNKGAQIIFGYEENEVENVSGVDQLFHYGGGPKEIMSVLAEVSEKGKYVGELTGTRKNGEKFPCNVVITPKRNRMGEIDGYVMIARDVLESKLLEKRLIRSERMSVVGTLTAGIAHELNNLLSGMSGYAELALRAKTSEKMERSLNLVKEITERAKNIIESLLSFSKAGEKEEQWELHSMDDVIESTLVLVARDFEKANIFVTKKFGEVPNVYCNADQLSLVFLNLMTNARDSMKEKEMGMLTICTDTVKKEEIENKNVKEGLVGEEFVRVKFIDTGVGMPPEVCDSIFEEFFTTKEEQMGKSKESGAGLGLSISKEIVHNHGGWITVKSTVDLGSEFIIYLPFARAVEEAEGEGAKKEPKKPLKAEIPDIEIVAPGMEEMVFPPKKGPEEKKAEGKAEEKEKPPKKPEEKVEGKKPEAEPEKPKPKPKKKKEAPPSKEEEEIPFVPLKILLVDDEEIVLNSLSELLSSEGHIVKGLDSAEKAIKVFTDEDFDLIISDVVMPGMDGLDLVKFVRKRSPDLPIIMITGYVESSSVEKAKRFGVKAVIKKPFRIEVVNELIKEVIDDKRRKELESE